MRRTAHVSRISPESVLNYLKVFLDDDDDDDDDDGGDDDDDDYLNPSHDVLKQLAVDFFTEAFLGVLTPIDVQIIHNEFDCPTLKMSWKQKLNMTKILDITNNMVNMITSGPVVKKTGTTNNKNKNDNNNKITQTKTIPAQIQ